MVGTIWDIPRLIFARCIYGYVLLHHYTHLCLAPTLTRPTHLHGRLRYLTFYLHPFISGLNITAGVTLLRTRLPLLRFERWTTRITVSPQEGPGLEWNDCLADDYRISPTHTCAR